ncbi:tetratricopeptide repeat protein [Streptomyces sp. NPDC101191]|uniref:tetratricopeptide repeat protein n=1 Tax=Streptomyces sp. NPDC101191 TaxID=3366126 RepID=UPI0037F304C0
MTSALPPAAKNTSSRAGRPGELALRLSAETHISYQKALDVVRQASREGRLPARLDDAGVDLALRVLLGQESVQWAPGLAGSPWPTSYEPLMSTLPGMRTEYGRQALAMATAAPRPGEPVEADCGFYSPEYLALEIGARRDIVQDKQDGIERDVLSWLLECLDARCAERPQQFSLPDPRGGHRVDEAIGLARRGDMTRAEAVLHRAVKAQPWDIDAYAHLGILTLMRHDDGEYGDPLSTATSHARRLCLDEALGYFEAAVFVGEALLPLPFTGLLPKDDCSNNAFYRAAGGLAHTLWRLGRHNAAERTLLSLLYINPLDNYGARYLLPLVRSGQRWTADLGDKYGS